MNPQESAEKIFTETMNGFTLFGEELAPYTAQRKVAAQSMGMLYPFVGEAGQKAIEESGIYPGAVKDMAIILWLCSVPILGKEKDDWTPSRATRNPSKALDAALKFAEEKEFVEPAQKPFFEAYQVFMAIVSGVSASEFSLKLSTNEPQPIDDPNDTKV